MISKKIQRMNERAAEIRQALEAAPARVAELRGAVTAAAGQVRQVRSELKSTVADVSSAVRGGPPPLPKAGESAAAKTLRAIEAAESVLKETGYQVDAMTLEVSSGQVRARLWRVADVRLVDLRAVLELYAKTPVEKALVTGLIEATEMAAGVALSGHGLAEVLLDAETGEVIRLGWRAEETHEAPASLPAASPNLSTLPPSSFFARPETAAPAAAAAPVPVVAPPPSPAKVEPAKPATTASLSRSSALDRFKKMPDLTKK